MRWCVGHIVCSAVQREEETAVQVRVLVGARVTIGIVRVATRVRIGIVRVRIGLSLAATSTYLSRATS